MQFIEHKDITELSNFRTPARARYFFELASREDIPLVFPAIHSIIEQGLPYIIITWGTNTLFAFDEYPWLVIFINLKGWDYDSSTHILQTSAAESIWEIAESLEKEYWQDRWHRFIGLPGSIAGAIYGNAGCFWLETAGNFVQVEVLHLETWKIELFQKQQMQFSYRSSRLKTEKKYLILSAVFDLSEIVEKYSSDVDNIYFREHMQPKGNSCGSFFKNPQVDREAFLLLYPELQENCPKQVSAGFLLEQVWLKWAQRWGAYFSQKHANFLMHDGQGSYKDLLNLLEEAQKKVQKKFSIFLESEVQIIYP